VRPPPNENPAYATGWSQFSVDCAIIIFLDLSFDSCRQSNCDSVKQNFCNYFCWRCRWCDDYRI